MKFKNYFQPSYLYKITGRFNDVIDLIIACQIAFD